jgi:hypothetical protein
MVSLASMLFYIITSFRKAKKNTSSGFQVLVHMVICVGFHYVTCKAVSTFFLQLEEMSRCSDSSYIYQMSIELPIIDLGSHNLGISFNLEWLACNDW